jgi:hypothetical protein
MKFKKNRKRLIKFATQIVSYTSSFVPSQTQIPEWYKKTMLTPKGLNKNTIPSVFSLKACSPFLDSFTSGYMLLTPCDIAVNNENYSDTHTSWNIAQGFDPIGIRNNTEANELLPIPEGHSLQHFTWILQLCFQIPKGYSVLLTHPLNRHDLPFTTLSGIIDGPLTPPIGQLPFFIKKSFNGIIPKGTPFAQVIPFKTENWNSEEDDSIFNEELFNKMSARTSQHWYKKNKWKKKKYY